MVSMSATRQPTKGELPRKYRNASFRDFSWEDAEIGDYVMVPSRVYPLVVQYYLTNNHVVLRGPGGGLHHLRKGRDHVEFNTSQQEWSRELYWNDEISLGKTE